MRERIIGYMKEFGSITTYNAFIDLGCSRLSEYIRQIKEEYKVADEWIHTINRYGEPVKYKRYWLED
jgi:hypothetical protein